MASMPGFIAMALCLALSKIPGLGGLEEVFNTLVGFLPIVLAAIAAKQVSGLDEVGIVAGIVGGALSVDGGIIGGLIVGILAGIFSYYIISLCFKYKVPGTTANIAAGGISGLVSGLIGMYAVAPAAAWIGDLIKLAIDWALDYNAILAGGVAGFAIWFAIIGGVYHAAILPIILLEMESTGFQLFGMYRSVRIDHGLCRNSACKYRYTEKRGRQGCLYSEPDYQSGFRNLCGGRISIYVFK